MELAPSIDAASYKLSSIPARPDEKYKKLRPEFSHAVRTPTLSKAQLGSASQFIFVFNITFKIPTSHAGLLEKKQQPVLPATDENIASALYTINKSAKVSRDTKNRSYYNRKFQCCGAAKTRMLNLYHLKDAVLKKLQEEDRVEYLGVNRQVFDYGPDSFLRLYRIGDFTFHIPCQKDEVNELEILDEEIDGEISAEKTRNVDINFRQAMLLLENYSGVKAAGTYNKKPEFY